MDIFARAYNDDRIEKYRTKCCALAQLSLSNDHYFEEIKSVIEEMKDEAITEMNMYERNTFGTHERAVFVITLPHENILVENLQKLGFEEIATFHRRNCYPEDSMLKMWLLSW